MKKTYIIMPINDPSSETKMDENDWWKEIKEVYCR
jgi:hypothetical protein